MLWVYKWLRRRWNAKRRLAAPPNAVPPSAEAPSLAERKRPKLERIRPLLRTDMPFRETALGFDYLTESMRTEFHVVDTANISSNEYDQTALDIIARHRDGLILDCGAGFRAAYHPNVVNFEICDYPSTDVRGVGERLPFRDGVFDAAFSLAVLEHVSDPFACAREIARTLKPGGTLYCVVPFLQPLHGYPNHFFNMTHQGLRTLFDKELIIEQQDVIPSGQPIWSLCWFVSRWAAGLSTLDRVKFLSLRLGDLLDEPARYLDKSYVRGLSKDMQFELASTTALIARKPER